MGATDGIGQGFVVLEGDPETFAERSVDLLNAVQPLRSALTPSALFVRTVGATDAGIR